MRKRIIIIHWKVQLVAICLLALFIIALLPISDISIYNNLDNHTPFGTYYEPGKPHEGSVEELNQDIYITLMNNSIQSALTNYYGVPKAYDPWGVTVLKVERPNGYRTYEFVITLEIITYVGAHNATGIDHITVRLRYGSTPIVENFKHIKSFPLPQH